MQPWQYNILFRACIFKEKFTSSWELSKNVLWKQTEGNSNCSDIWFLFIFTYVPYMLANNIILESIK